MFYETKDHHGLKHNPFKSLVVPRPIGWVSSMAADGTVNLAPYSFFNAMAANPPAVALGCNGLHVEGGAKDTVVNIETTGEFVVNIATWELREQMNLTSASVPRSIDEMREAGLEPAPCNLIKPPRVAAAPVNLECTYLQTVDLPSDHPDSKNQVVFGLVVGIHIADEIIADGMIDMSRFKPIARLGYMDYTAVDNVFTMGRPK